MAEAAGNVVDFRVSSSDDNMEEINIRVHLKDIVSTEGSERTFLCWVSGDNRTIRWYKDGIPILETDRVRLSETEDWCKLTIKSMRLFDEGVYTVVCSNAISYAISQACLHVVLLRTTLRPEYLGALYFMPSKLYVVKHLHNIRINKGENIKLEAYVKCNSNATVRCRWYKNNTPIAQSISDLSDSNKCLLVSSVEITKAQECDSGMYLLVAYTTEGMVSTMGEVFVTNLDLSHLINTVNPSFLEPPKEEIYAHKTEPVRIMCKVAEDQDTEIEWLRNVNVLEDGPNYTYQHYGKGMFGLLLSNSDQDYTGDYTVRVRSLIDGKTSTSTCCVLFDSTCPLQSPEISVKIPLRSVATSIGAKVCFNCSFNIDQEKNLYVVWLVGPHKVERSNRLFEIITNGMDYILYIQNVEPDMPGEVTCQLRQRFPMQPSILITSTSAQLIQIPYCLVHRQVLSNSGPIKAEKVYIEFNTENCTALWSAQKQRTEMELNDDNEPFALPFAPRYHRHDYDHLYNVMFKKPRVNIYTYFANDPKEDNATKSDRPSVVVEEDAAHAAEGGDNVMMDILFCRLHDYGTNFLTLINCGEKHSSIHVVATNSLHANFRNMVNIEWQYQSSLPSDTWFVVESRQRSGRFFSAGVTSKPSFTIRNPLVNCVMRFRIRTISAQENTISAQIMFAPGETETGTISTMEKNYDLSADFNKIYKKTDMILGHGAFGQVVLIVSKDEMTFRAGKMIRTRTQKKRDQARREYHIMSKLKHPRIVELHHAFFTNDWTVLVMDHMWGGELFERIVDEENFQEDIAVIYVRQILEALVYMHDKQIAHLDLKPENILCEHPNSRQIKLVDFGLSREIDEGKGICVMYGTRDYIAPETLNYEPQGTSCDMWSLGVVTYVMLSGVVPFPGDDWPTRSANIIRGNYDYDEPSLATLSSSAKQFIDQLLVKASVRLTARKALQHPWLVGETQATVEIGRLRHWRNNLRTYLANHKARWQRAGNVVIAANRWLTLGSASQGPAT